ncbi:MAG: SCO family protein [Gammaproteobacteria bacterium]|nr:SCO family protein [Gammaproteobacteria bacterium]
MSLPRTKNLAIGTLVLSVFFILVMFSTWLLVKRPDPPAELQAVLNPQFKQLQAFSLDSSQGKLGNEDFLGKWSFVFFGYTSCPDICPTTLHTLSRFYSLLKDGQSELEDIQVIFISVDPGRDTMPKLAEYVGYFNQRFIAATTSESKIERFAKQFGAGFIIEPETAPERYIVIHTSAIFLVDPFGRQVASFSQPHYAATIHAQFEKIRQHFAG